MLKRDGGGSNKTAADDEANPDDDNDELCCYWHVQNLWVSVLMINSLLILQQLKLQIF